MKKNKAIWGIAMSCIFVINLALQAQEKTSSVVVVTRAHWDMTQKDFSMAEWKKTEGEYHEKVTLKNDLITGSQVLLHAYTPDNSEIIFVSVYKNWEDVEKAVAKNNELAKAAWPDKEARMAFFKKQSAYYSAQHSDEIYATFSHTKPKTSKSDTSLIYYVKTSHMVWPNDGKETEIDSLDKEFFDHVTAKNKDILGYYPMRHMYGADSREMIEVFVCKSMAELENMNNTSTSQLIMAHWPDKTKRTAFFDAYNKYTSPWHGDLIYSNVPELEK